MHQKEVWKPIAGFPHYQVSNRGRVRSLDRVGKGNRGQPVLFKGQILAQRPSQRYRKVVLCEAGRVSHHNVHRLVAQRFISNPLALPCINHRDGNRNNNAVENLEWCTYSHNSRDMYQRNWNHHSAQWASRLKKSAGMLEALAYIGG